MLFRKGTPPEFFEFIKKLEAENKKDGNTSHTPGVVSTHQSVKTQPITSAPSPDVTASPTVSSQLPSPAQPKTTTYTPQQMMHSQPQVTSSSSLQKTITLRQDQLLVVLIGIFLAVVISFALGHTWGKRTSNSQQNSLLGDENIRKDYTENLLGIGTGNGEVKDDKRSTVVDKGPYTVVVATYTLKQRKLAEQCMKDLNELRYNAYIHQTSKHLVVCVGHFENTKNPDTQKMLKSIKLIKKKRKNPFKDAYLRRF